MTVASGNESERHGMEQGFKDRIQETTTNFLRYPIPNCWNTQRTELRLILGDEYSPKRVRLKRTRFEVAHQRAEVVGKVGLKHLNADLVDARRATIALDGLEGVEHQSVGDTSGEGVGFDDLGH